MQCCSPVACRRNIVTDKMLPAKVALPWKGETLRATPRETVDILSPTIKGALISPGGGFRTTWPTGKAARRVTDGRLLLYST